MSERLKRRKKSADPTTKETTKAAEPLQPRFYDDDPAAATSGSLESDASEARRPSPPEPETQPVPEPVAAPAQASVDGEAKPRTPRRRRSRGGRGGSRPRAATAPAAAEATAEVSALEPSLPGTSEGTSAEASVEALAPEQIVALPSPTEPVATQELPAQSVPAQSVPPQAAPVQAAPLPARASKGTVVLAIGLPGSGKSSWFKRHSIHPLSSDLLRELLFDDAQEQRFQDLVFSNLRSMLKARLIARRPMNYVDATNLTPHDRHS